MAAGTAGAERHRRWRDWNAPTPEIMRARARMKRVMEHLHATEVARRALESVRLLGGPRAAFPLLAEMYKTRHNRLTARELVVVELGFVPDRMRRARTA